MTAVFQPIVDRLRERWPASTRYVCFDPPAGSDVLLGFEDWIGAQDGDTEWADGDEREPCMLCYTSGTTGNPKGVLYEHRSTVLHAMTADRAQLLRFRFAQRDAAGRADVPCGQLGPAVGRGDPGDQVRLFARSTIRRCCAS